MADIVFTAPHNTEHAPNAPQRIPALGAGPHSLPAPRLAESVPLPTFPTSSMCLLTTRTTVSATHQSGG